MTKFIHALIFGMLCGLFIAGIGALHIFLGLPTPYCVVLGFSGGFSAGLYLLYDPLDYLGRK